MAQPRIGLGDKIALIIFLAILTTALIKFGNLENKITDMFFRITTSTKITATKTSQEERIVLVVNKTLEEWKKIYRDYIIYSDRMIKEKHVVTGEHNLTKLLEIIDRANSPVIIRKFYFYDDVIQRYVVLKVVIPLFIVELHEKNIPEYGIEPMLKATAEILKKYVEKTPSNYTEYRLALMVLKIASEIHYKWEPKSYDLLLEIVYDQGNCDSKTWLAIELAANVGLWSADLIA